MPAYILLFLRAALILTLYGFLGWALYTLWQDLKTQNKPPGLKNSAYLTLTVESASGPVTYRFQKLEILIGRDPSCDCQIDDKTVSSQHARLSFHHLQWWLEDLNSTNGTFLDQEAVVAPIVVTQGDIFRCGRMLVEIGGDE